MLRAREGHIASDPRLVALGLAPAPVEDEEPVPVAAWPAPSAFPSWTPAAPAPAPPEPVAWPSAPTYAPAPADEAVVPAAMTPTATPAVLGTTILALPITWGFPAQQGDLELATDGIRAPGVAITWPAIRRVRAARGRVCIESAARPLSFAVAHEGVAEPSLAAPLVRLLDDARERGLDRTSSAALELQNARDALRDRFHDEDDPLIPGLVGVVLALGGATLVAMLPHVLAAGGPALPPEGGFLIDAPLAPLDPRVIVSGFAAAALLASLVVRVAMGAHALAWARGTLRGWHTDRLAAVRYARALLALVVLRPGIVAAVLLLGITATLPSTRAQVLVSEDGVHLVRELSFLDERWRWSDVSDVAMTPPDVDPLRYDIDVVLRGPGGTLSTQERIVYGGSELQLLQRSRAWRDAAR